MATSCSLVLIKRALGSHRDRDVCLSKLFRDRDVGLGQWVMTFSGASHFQGLWLQIRVASRGCTWHRYT